MPDIIQEAWRSVSECKLLAEQATDAQARQFFLNLASSWQKIASNYEILAQNDCYLIELKREREIELAARSGENQRPARNPIRSKKPAWLNAILFWRRFSALAPARRAA
jgi:hypothetical protein